MFSSLLFLLFQVVVGQGDCRSCSSGSTYWCGGSDQRCVSRPSLCSTSVYNNNCYASYSSACSTSGASTCSSSSSMASVYTTCSTCTSTSSFYWCGGSDQKCVASLSSCSSSVYNSGCYTSYSFYSTSCSSSGSSTCSFSSSSSYSREVIDENVPAAIDQVTIGVVISMILGVFCFLAILLSARLYCNSTTSTPSPFMDAWKSRTSSAFPVHAMGIVFQSLGLITGFAAPAIPWMSTVFSASLSPSASVIYSTMTYTYTDSSGNIISGILPFFFYIGSIIAYIALCSLVFPSLLLAWVVACRISNVSKWGTAPPVRGTCNAGMPVVQGLAWGGTILFL